MIKSDYLVQISRMIYKVWAIFDVSGEITLNQMNHLGSLVNCVTYPLKFTRCHESRKGTSFSNHPTALA